MNSNITNDISNVSDINNSYTSNSFQNDDQKNGKFLEQKCIRCFRCKRIPLILFYNNYFYYKCINDTCDTKSVRKIKDVFNKDFIALKDFLIGTKKNIYKMENFIMNYQIKKLVILILIK